MRVPGISAVAVAVVIVGAMGAANVVGCGSSSSSEFGSSSGEQPDGSPGDPGFGGGDSGGVRETFASIQITPADVVVPVALGQKTPATDFTAKGIRADGTSVPILGDWDFTRVDAAAFEGARLVPTGFVGGKGEVSFRYGTQVAKTSATIKLLVTDGVAPDPTVVTALANATDADPAVNVIYPYDGTVFPRGFPSPVVQWTGGAAQDLYSIEAKGEAFEFRGWSSVAPPARYPFPSVPADVWAKLTDSTAGAVTFSVQRWDGAKAYLPKKQTWKIAPGNLKGTIYYTRLKTNFTDVRRLATGKTAESFLEKTSGVSCIACHSVSRDGLRVVASVNGGASPWATYDAVTGKELYRSSQSSGFQAISPNGSHVLWRHWTNGSFGTENKLRLSTYDNDAVLAELAPPAGNGAPSHQVWSPDGKRVAFGMRTAGNGLNYNAATLWTAGVDLANPAFSDIKKIVDATTEFPVASYASYTPDSQWLAFMRATQSRSDGTNPRGQLWLTSVDGATQLPLDRANGAPDLGTATDKNWFPSVHPIAAGGYFWVAFTSSRPYGHTTFTTQRQVWIAAIDASPKSGQDPSHPAFYITGQDDDSYVERPQFTVSPCKPLGQTCENGYDCCDGYCRAGSDGKLVCQNKSNACAQTGDKCETSADCCSGLGCVGGFCAPTLPN